MVFKCLQILTFFLIVIEMPQALFAWLSIFFAINPVY